MPKARYLVSVLMIELWFLIAQANKFLLQLY